LPKFGCSFWYQVLVQPLSKVLEILRQSNYNWRAVRLPYKIGFKAFCFVD